MFDNGSSKRNLFRTFSRWVRWQDRVTLIDKSLASLGTGAPSRPVGSYPGLYLLAHFRRAPVGAADYLDRNIVYVGEGDPLSRRWYQFERSALHGLPGHSGGHSYRREFGDRAWSNLHVSALPICFGTVETESLPGWTRAYRLHVERAIIWERTKTGNGKHGLLNKK